MGVTCSCMEERVKFKDTMYASDKQLSSYRSEKSVSEEQATYGSIGKYQINKQTGKWKASGGGVFLGHLTEGKVQIDREDTFVQQLAEFEARFNVRFSMPDIYMRHKGDILLTVDCFTSRSLHSADIILNGEKLRSKVEV